MSNSSPSESGAAPNGNRERGKLKVFLGYAAGVGKTYQMLAEAQDRKRQGVDVIVGYFEPHARADTIAQLGDLELVPRLAMQYRGANFEEMDVDAIRRRQPAICAVDEFPHTNVPGSARGKRWEDVLVLLEDGIDVWTTMNVQHLESLNDQVYEISGIRVRETVPDWVVQQAAEVVMVDLTPRALLNRLDRGAVYQGDKAQRAKENFFKESTLAALRELALRQTAFEVESRHPSAAAATGERPRQPPLRQTFPPPPAERVLIYITPDPSSAALIRRAKRVADYMQGDCVAVAVCPSESAGGMPGAQRDALERHLNFARNLHIETHLMTGHDAAAELVAFAREHKVTQIYIARPRVAGWDLPLRRDLVERVALLTPDMEVTIVAQHVPWRATKS